MIDTDMENQFRKMVLDMPGLCGKFDIVVLEMIFAMAYYAGLEYGRASCYDLELSLEIDQFMAKLYDEDGKGRTWASKLSE